MINTPDDFIRHPYLYKYKDLNSPNTLNSLEEGYIYLPNRRQLNDPFDCSTNLVEIIKDDNFIKESLKKLRKESLYRKNLTRQQNRKIEREYLDQGGHWQTLHQTMLDTINSCGIGCFTKAPNNLSMWSHYANFHTGICLQYDVTKDSGFFNNVFEINYVDKFETKNFVFNDPKKLQHIFQTKSSCWSNEFELRILKLKYGKYPVKKAALTSVIFGLKCSNENKKLIIDIVSKNNPSAVFYNSTPLKNHFGIKLTQVELSRKN